MKACVACGGKRVDAEWLCADCNWQPGRIDGIPTFAPGLAKANDGFREEYFAGLATIEARNFWFRARSSLILWAINTYFRDCKTFLEIGCGTGFVLNGIRSEFPDMRLSGSEISIGGLGFAAKRVPSATAYQMDARSIPFEDEFDLIGAFDVLEHIDDDEVVMAGVHRALRPGGGFLITVPQHQQLWSRQDVAACHVRRYSADGLRNKMERAGFDVVRMISYVSLLLPLLVASRLRMRADTAADVDALDALTLPPPIDSMLGLVMRLEGTLIRRGWRFPAGGSLIAVARKRS